MRLLEGTTVAEAVSWDAALHELCRFVPSATAFLSPDRVSAAAGKTEWRPLREWEDLPDVEILDRVYAGHAPLTGLLVLANHHMAFHGSPVRLSAEQLRAFVGGHLASAGECFFNGDVVVLAVDIGRLMVFHHEGWFAHWDLSRTALRTPSEAEPGAGPVA